MKIVGDALELALRVVLSCPCPVTSEQERRVFDLACTTPSTAVVDYGAVLSVFSSDDTPFHRLAEFATWMAHPGEEPVIERHHVLRANASTLHWRHAASTLPGAVGRVARLPSWLTAHLILPVRLQVSDDEPSAVYEYSGGHVTLRNVFVPPEFEPSAHELWAIHFAAVLGHLSAAEYRLLVDLTEANPGLRLHREHVGVIDYRRFELQGDNTAFCRRRHDAYWGGEGVVR